MPGPDSEDFTADMADAVDRKSAQPSAGEPYTGLDMVGRREGEHVAATDAAKIAALKGDTGAEVKATIDPVAEAKAKLEATPPTILDAAMGEATGASSAHEDAWAAARDAERIQALKAEQKEGGEEAAA